MQTTTQPRHHYNMHSCIIGPSHASELISSLEIKTHFIFNDTVCKGVKIPPHLPSCSAPSLSLPFSLSTAYARSSRGHNSYRSPHPPPPSSLPSFPLLRRPPSLSLPFSLSTMVGSLHIVDHHTSCGSAMPSFQHNATAKSRSPISLSLSSPMFSFSRFVPP
ncbi:hypothetical protein CIPAW_02G073200 [Carya illinoinensis]|uniref:Uncharacterized protein n=1 Tax=Carya illinoinensis TaxID=32201 RepID=A0A8T1R9L8_CARIL|nr:hypothetical protein CIPAW_02G073200 [Carya illinoinensis]